MIKNYFAGRMQDLHISYNNPYNANPNSTPDLVCLRSFADKFKQNRSGSTNSFSVSAAPFQGVMN